MPYFSIDQPRTISLCNKNYSPEGILHPDRIMEEYDFLYMVNGEWEIYEEEHAYTLTPGSLLILQPGKHHFSKKKCTADMRNMFLHCNQLSSDRVANNQSIFINKLTDCKTKSDVNTLFESIIETYWNTDKSFKDLRLNAMFQLLLTSLGSSATKQTISNDPLVSEILRLFSLESHRFFTLTELAERFYVSPRTISKHFRQSTSLSVHQYQLNLKLSMAHEQLPFNGQRGLRDLALSYGFYDEFHFSKLYKRKYGYSPSIRQKK